MAAAWALIALWWAFTAASYLFLAATYLARVASHLLRSTVPILGASFSMSMSPLAAFFSSSAFSSARLVGQALLRTPCTERLFLASVLVTWFLLSAAAVLSAATSWLWPESRSLLRASMAASIAFLLFAKSWAWALAFPSCNNSACSAMWATWP